MGTYKITFEFSVKNWNVASKIFNELLVCIEEEGGTWEKLESNILEEIIR